MGNSPCTMMHPMEISALHQPQHNKGEEMTVANMVAAIQRTKRTEKEEVPPRSSPFGQPVHSPGIWQPAFHWLGNHTEMPLSASLS